MAEPTYLFRLDDACPWMDHRRWSALEALFDQYSVRPIVAIVPQCEDPALKVAEEDPLFWEKARRWQAKGWTIGLHGWDHVFTGRSPGLVPLNHYTEFAGRPETEQRDKIRRGWQALSAQGLTPAIWVAPAHTFDRSTLHCLAEETPIRLISDGLSFRPFLRFGFSWLPQQLWKPRSAPLGIWTICLHPNEMDDQAFREVQEFLSSQHKVISVDEVKPVNRSWSLWDGLFETGFRLARGAKRLKRMGK